jgi:hypothetical protein
MINHRERFLQRYSKKYKAEMTTDWILDQGLEIIG